MNLLHAVLFFFYASLLLMIVEKGTAAINRLRPLIEFVSCIFIIGFAFWTAAISFNYIGIRLPAICWGGAGAIGFWSIRYFGKNRIGLGLSLLAAAGLYISLFLYLNHALKGATW